MSCLKNEDTIVCFNGQLYIFLTKSEGVAIVLGGQARTATLAAGFLPRISEKSLLK